LVGERFAQVRQRGLRQDDAIDAWRQLCRSLAHEAIVQVTPATGQGVECRRAQDGLRRDIPAGALRVRSQQCAARCDRRRGRADQADAARRACHAGVEGIVDLEDWHTHRLARGIDGRRGRRARENDQLGTRIGRHL